MSLGDNISSKRQTLKFSQEYVAEKLGVSRQAVSKWETNQSEPSTSNLIKLADLFDCDVNEIISPEKYLEEQKNTKKSVVDQTKRNINMQLAAVFGRVFILISFLGWMDAYSSSDQVPEWLSKTWWGGLFLIGLVLTFRASRDYFNKQKGSRKIIYYSMLFIFSFFLYTNILPFANNINTLITLLYGAVILSIMNIKFWIPAWRKS